MAFVLTVTVTDDTSLATIPDCKTWVTSDLAGTTTLFEVYTDTVGVSAYSLAAGTYYLWAQKAGYTFTNPTTVVIAAAKAQSVTGAAIPSSSDWETTIVNMALAFLSGGKDTTFIEDINDTSDQTAKIAVRFYETARDAVMARVMPKAAFKFRNLGAAVIDDMADLPAHADWEYGFNLPGDLLGDLIWQTDENDHTLRYEFEIIGRILFTNDLTDDDGDSAYVMYVSKLTNTGQMTAALHEAIAWKLAGYLVGPIKPDQIDYTRARLKEAIGAAQDEVGRSLYKEPGSYSWLEARE